MTGVKNENDVELLGLEASLLTESSSSIMQIPTQKVHKKSKKLEKKKKLISGKNGITNTAVIGLQCKLCKKLIGKSESQKEYHIRGKIVMVMVT